MCTIVPKYLGALSKKEDSDGSYGRAVSVVAAASFGGQCGDVHLVTWLKEPQEKGKENHEQPPLNS